MRVLLGFVVVLALLCTVGDAQFHDMKFLMGGYNSSSTLYLNGVWLADANAQTFTHLTPNQKVYYSRAMRMDANNKDVIFTAEGSTSSTYATYLRSGLYRVNPQTLAISTIYHSTLDTYAARHVIINQDGDYVFTSYHANTSPTSRTYSIMKVDAASNLTTVFSSMNLGGTFTGYGLGRDIDTGHYLVNVYRSGTLYYGVALVAEDGTWTTFAGGTSSSNYGWYGYYSKLEQNLTTGDLEGYYSRNIYQLKRGSSGPRTTLWSIGLPGGITAYNPGVTDNQSAASPRFIAAAYETRLINALTHRLPVVLTIENKPPYTVTATNVDPTNANGLRYNYCYGIEFYQGRHVQPVKTAPNKWDLSFSCPQYPNKSYIAAITMKGVRPAIPLLDGRKIHIVPDVLTYVTIGNLLKPYFDAGPGVLNAKGEALGGIDLSTIGKVGMPLWIQLIVLDPMAPGGIAYIPDPYVMRV